MPPLTSPPTGFEIVSADLRAAARAAGAGSELRPLFDRAALAIDDLDGQRHELEMGLAELRARMPAGHDERSLPDRGVVDAITGWLEALDPGQIDQLAPPAISRAFVEASLAADRVVTEAIGRAEALIDFVATAVADLLRLIDDERDRPEVASWHHRFTARSRALITQLRLPATVPVADLIELLGAVAPPLTAGPR